MRYTARKKFGWMPKSLLPWYEALYSGGPTSSGPDDGGGLPFEFRISRVMLGEGPSPECSEISVSRRSHRTMRLTFRPYNYSHPLFAQLFGLHCSTSLNALLYHDEMMTIDQVEQMHSHSVLASDRRLPSFRGAQYDTADEYLSRTTAISLEKLSGSTWIRVSTGRLCFDIGNGNESFYSLTVARRLPLPAARFNLADPNLVNNIAQTLTFDDVVDTFEFYSYFSGPLAPLGEGGTILPSFALFSDRNPLYPFPSSFPTRLHFVWQDWHHQKQPIDFTIMDQAHAWTSIQYNADSFPIVMSVGLDPGGAATVKRWWLAQEPHIRKNLQSHSSWLELTTAVSRRCDQDYESFMAKKPAGKIYLLLPRPTMRYQTSGHLEVVFPRGVQEYYWAFDKDGRDRLTCDMVHSLGFPSLGFTFAAGGVSVHEEQSSLLRSIFAAKGYDPDTQNAAIERGYPRWDCESTTQEVSSSSFEFHWPIYDRTVAEFGNNHRTGSTGRGGGAADAGCVAMMRATMVRCSYAAGHRSLVTWNQRLTLICLQSGRRR
ncbi:hypothetical protein FB45DRAFT_933211 [Roridomyces roridus]|uniref:Uncharacterized protein n=1 Tax=Roridomyces roridus TaxID=1738132 RepID=A0AAD7BDW6_9AGAR|nr:hypothetical protein FB45DRAFT_933211 [Roridomyces roridus]